MQSKTRLYINIATYSLVIISVVFLIRYLVKNNLLYVPTRINWLYGAASILLAMLGHLFSCKGWQLILRTNGIGITYREAVLSLGISTLGKYIPGKVWLIAGASGRVASTTGKPLAKVTYISTLGQILGIAIALAIGVASLYGKVSMPLLVLFYFSILTIITLTIKYKSRIMSFSVFEKNKFAEKWIKPMISSISFPFILASALAWLSWCIGFFLMARSIIPGLDQPMLGFSFALAAALGILALIAPGGLGIREGVLGLVLTGFMSNKQDITTVAAFSRLWYLIGELFIFSLAAGLLIRDWLKKRSENQG